MPPTQLAGALEARVDAGQIEAAELVDERPLGIAVVEHGAVSTSADVADDHKILISAAPLADIGRAQQVDARRCISAVYSRGLGGGCGLFVLAIGALLLAGVLSAAMSDEHGVGHEEMGEFAAEYATSHLT